MRNIINYRFFPNWNTTSRKVLTDKGTKHQYLLGSFTDLFSRHFILVTYVKKWRCDCNLHNKDKQEVLTELRRIHMCKTIR